MQDSHTICSDSTSPGDSFIIVDRASSTGLMDRTAFESARALPGAASPTEPGETTNTGGSSSSWDHQQPENLCDKVKRLREAATELKAKRDRVNKDIKMPKGKGPAWPKRRPSCPPPIWSTCGR